MSFHDIYTTFIKMLFILFLGNIYLLLPNLVWSKLQNVVV